MNNKYTNTILQVTEAENFSEIPTGWAVPVTTGTELPQTIPLAMIFFQMGQNVR